MSVNKELADRRGRRFEAEELQGTWLVTGRYYCYGNEEYPDEEYLLSYETPVWEFKEGRAEFKDLAFPFSIVYTYRIVSGRLVLQPHDGSLEELYRVDIAGNNASLYLLEQTWLDDGEARCLTETIRIELERLP